MKYSNEPFVTFHRHCDCECWLDRERERKKEGERKRELLHDTGVKEVCNWQGKVKDQWIQNDVCVCL